MSTWDKVSMHIALGRVTQGGLATEVLAGRWVKKGGARMECFPLPWAKAARLLLWKLRRKGAMTSKAPVPRFVDTDVPTMAKRNQRQGEFKKMRKGTMSSCRRDVTASAEWTCGALQLRPTKLCGCGRWRPRRASGAIADVLRRSALARCWRQVARGVCRAVCVFRHGAG